jgi:thymidylate synthase
MSVVFRSNDMLLAAGANMFALTSMMVDVQKRIDDPELGIGTYTHVSLVPHIYYRRDATYLKPYLEYLPYNKIKSLN